LELPEPLLLNQGFNLMQCNFHGKRVLVVEDNYIVATEITASLEAANAVVLGPCSNLEDAGMQVAHSELAILDVDIRGRTSFALADRLIRLDVPYVFFTGYDRAFLPERFSGIDVITKPRPSEAVVQQLGVASQEVRSSNIVALIPHLRARARGLLPDPLAADRLVERTLQFAIDDPTPWLGRQDVAAWLNRLMDRALTAGRRQILN
jgi:CheY-like chemotaxis protein